MLSEAPDDLREVQRFLKLAVETWMTHANRPKLDSETEKRWDGYIERWIATPDLPLFIRGIYRQRAEG